MEAHTPNPLWRGTRGREAHPASVRDEISLGWGVETSIIYIYIPFFFFGCDKSSLLHGLSLVVVSRSYSPAVVLRLLIAVAPLLFSCGGWDLEHRLSSCGAQA